MDCDEVFRVLVSAPFPTGGPTDDAVERHLYRCASCAEIAEALRPAPEVLHEALAPREIESLPGYHGSVGCDALVPDFGAWRTDRLASGALATQRRPAIARSRAARALAVRSPRRVSWARTAVALGAIVSAIAAANSFAW